MIKNYDVRLQMAVKTIFELVLEQQLLELVKKELPPEKDKNIDQVEGDQVFNDNE